MLDVLQKKLEPLKKNEKYDYLREYLQLLILKILDEKGYFRNISFVGGTALRILYDLNRFSEDLDFCLIDQEYFQFKKMMHTLTNELKQLNLSAEVTAKDNKTVSSAFIRFSGLLFELGLSPHKDQKVSLKVEIDGNPPAGFHTQFTMINKEFLIGINHYDLPSLLAGKLHAILCRKYTKGRDYYDLIWFMGRKVTPNYTQLSNAIMQTEKKQINLDATSLNKLLHDRLKETDFKKVRADIEPFLIDHKELRYFEQDYFLKLFEVGFISH